MILLVIRGSSSPGLVHALQVTPLTCLHCHSLLLVHPPCTKGETSSCQSCVPAFSGSSLPAWFRGSSVLCGPACLYGPSLRPHHPLHICSLWKHSFPCSLTPLHPSQCLCTPSGTLSDLLNSGPLLVCAPLAPCMYPGSDTHTEHRDGLPIWAVRRDMTSVRVLSSALSPRQYTSH